MIAPPSATTVLDTARTLQTAGISFVPADPKTKRPSMRHLPREWNEEEQEEKPVWKPFQSAHPTDDDVQRWFIDRGRTDAIAVVCGEISGGLLVFDFDVPGFFEAWREEAGNLAEGLPVQRTGGGGYQIFCRCPNPGGNEKLAWEPDAAAADKRKIAIETRGDKGYALVPPSLHPSGNRYQMIEGSLAAIPEISQAHADALKAAARKLCKAPWSKQILAQMDQAKAAAQKSTVYRKSLNGQASVIDAFNEHHSLREVLKHNGYVDMGSRMLRPNADPDSQPGVCFFDRDGKEVCYCWSSNDPLHDKHAHDAFSVFCELEHAGDFKKAVRAAAEMMGMSHKAHTDSEYPSEEYLDSLEAKHAAGAIGQQPVAPPVVEFKPTSASELIATRPELRPSLIRGLMRVGEVMNVVGAPKSRKTWLVLAMILCFVAKRMWLGLFQTAGGKVLVFDNELHPETIANRIPKVASALGITEAEYGDNLHYYPLRGRLCDIDQLDPIVRSIPKGTYALVVIDAAYRVFPKGFEENGNSDWTQLMNKLDLWAEMLGCGIVIVHHSSKGAQGEKSVTDMGAGGSAQARAADTHLVVREHEDEDCTVLQAAVRSWEPLPPVGVRWQYPVHTADSTIDVTKLKKPPGRGGRPKKDEAKTAEGEAPAPWTPERFTTEFVTDKPTGRNVITSRANRAGLTFRAIDGLIAEAEVNGLIHRHATGKTTGIGFATVKPTLFSEQRESAHTPPSTPSRRRKKTAATG